MKETKTSPSRGPSYSQLFEELLQTVELESENEHSHELTNEEKTAINEGIEDADSGNIHSNSEASGTGSKMVKAVK